MIKIYFKNVIFICLAGISLWYLYQSIIFSQDIIAGVSDTISRIINVVFPSLFGFMVMCEILIKSGLYKYMLIILKPLSKYIFRIPHELFSVYFLSLIGGYPVGIKMLSLLCDKKVIDKETASRFLPFCYCVSPSFAVGIVGISVFNNINVGVVVYLSCVLANTILLLIYSHLYKFKSVYLKNKIEFSSKIIVESVVSCGKSMLSISFVIIFFSYFIILLDCLNFYDIIKLKGYSEMLKSVFDVTYLSLLPSDLNLLPIVTGIISTGGFCILLQLICINRNYFSLKRLFFMRIPVFILSYLICNVISGRILLYKSSISYAFSHNKNENLNIFSLICLFFMIIMIFFQKKNCNFKKSML